MVTHSIREAIRAHATAAQALIAAARRAFERGDSDEVDRLVGEILGQLELMVLAMPADEDRP